MDVWIQSGWSVRLERVDEGMRLDRTTKPQCRYTEIVQHFLLNEIKTWKRSDKCIICVWKKRYSDYFLCMKCIVWLIGSLRVNSIRLAREVFIHRGRCLFSIYCVVSLAIASRLGLRKQCLGCSFVPTANIYPSSALWPDAFSCIR